MEALLNSQLSVLNTELERSELQIKELLLLISAEVSTPGNWIDPQTALDSLIHGKQLEQSTCHDTSVEQVSELLRSFAEDLDKNVMESLDIIDRLVHLSADFGILLPFGCSTLLGPGLEETDFQAESENFTSSGGYVGDSTLSLNTVSGDVEQDNALSWNHLCKRLTKRIVEKMSLMTADQVLKQDETYRRYVEALLLLNTPVQAWFWYRRARTCQVEGLVKTYFGIPSETESEKRRSFAEIAVGFSTFIELISGLIAQDFDYIRLDYFTTVPNAQDTVVDIYLDYICEELGDFVEVLEREISSSNQRQKSKQKKSSLRRKDNVLSNANVCTSSSSAQNQRRMRFADVCVASDISQDQIDDLSGDLKGILNFDTFMSAIAVATGFCALERRLLLVANDYWAKATHGCDPERSLKFAHTHIFGKPKGVLKKRRSSNALLRHQAVNSFNVTSEGALTPPRVSSQTAIKNPFCLTADTPESYSPVVQEGLTQEQPYLDWQIELEHIFPLLANSLEMHLTAVWRRGLRNRARCQVTEALVLGRLGYPKIVWKGVYDYSEVVMEVLPFAAHCAQSEENAIKFQVALVQTLAQHCLQWTTDYLQSRLDNGLQSPIIPADAAINASSTSYGCLHKLEEELLLLSNSLYLRLQAGFVVTALLTRSEHPCLAGLQSSLKQFAETILTFESAIHDWLGRLMTTALLHDADSHRWSDSKEFHEEERVSFSLQRCSAELQRVWICASTILPARTAREMLLVLLERTVRILTQRYAQALPTVRRLKQMRADLTCILLMSEEWLYTVCDQGDQLIRPCPNEEPRIVALHQACTALLQVLAIVTSPLEDLHHFHRRGINKARRRGSSSISASEGAASTETNKELPSGSRLAVARATGWLSHLRKGIFVPHLTSFAELHTAPSLYVQVRFVAASPSPAFSQILKLLVMKEFALPVMLLTHLAELETNGGGNVKTRGAATAPEFGFLLFFRALSACPIATEGLTRVMSAILNRVDGWAALDLVNRNAPISAWLEALLQLLEPLLEKCVESARLAQHSFSFLPNLPSLHKKIMARHHSLPCGCATRPCSLELSKTALSTETGVLAIALSALHTDCSTFPASILLLLSSLAPENAPPRKRPNCSIGIQLLLMALYRKLSAAGWAPSFLLEQLASLQISFNNEQPAAPGLEECTDALQQIVHLLDSFSPHHLAPDPVQLNTALQEQQLLAEQICIMAEAGGFLDKDFAAANCSIGLEQDNTFAFMNEHTPLGSLYLIHQLVIRNQDWILNNLGLASPFTEESALIDCSKSSSQLSFEMDTSPCESEPFNPLVGINCLGRYGFNQTALLNFPWSWKELLSADLGFTEICFKNLLSHRPEMQDGAHLDPHEIPLVEQLIAKYELLEAAF